VLAAGFYPATAMPDSGWWEILWPRPNEVIVALGVPPGSEAIDLCCGDGLFTLPLAQIAGSVVGIDLDPRMLALARARLDASGLTNCTLIEGDAYDVARLVPEPVDYMLIANTFHGVPDKPRLATAMAAALKPRGRLAIINWHRRPREETVVLGQPRGPKMEMRMEPAEVAAALKPFGLAPAQLLELPPYHYASIFTRTAS
jgi:ubiquinone/menaquinone biosynthesis C-methylase UbiE